MKRFLLLAAAATAFAALIAGASAQSSQIPAGMIGTWGYEAKSCTDPADDGRMNVTRKSVELFASGCDIRTVRQSRAGGLTLRGICSDEGESTKRRGTMALRLVGPDRLELKLGPDDAHIYQKCPKPMSVR